MIIVLCNCSAIYLPRIASWAAATWFNAPGI